MPVITASIQQVIGAALDRIGTYNDLDNKQHVIALIDPEMCINCGKWAQHFEKKHMVNKTGIIRNYLIMFVIGELIFKFL